MRQLIEMIDSSQFLPSETFYHVSAQSHVKIQNLEKL